jgi:hypothetical protein
MHPAISDPPRREPENELYDLACDLVEAAAAIRQLAREPDTVQAVPAVLGSVHDAIGNLSIACVEMEQTVAEAVRAHGHGDDRWRRRVTDRMHRGFENLSTALEDGQRASGACRALVARVLALGSGEPRRRGGNSRAVP